MPKETAKREVPKPFSDSVNSGFKPDDWQRIPLSHLSKNTWLEECGTSHKEAYFQGSIIETEVRLT